MKSPNAEALKRLSEIEAEFNKSIVESQTRFVRMNIPPETLHWLLSQLRASLEAEQLLVEALQDAVDELRPYSQGCRDKSFEGWQLKWQEVKVLNEFDYEFYPNHVDKETIERFEQALANHAKLRGKP